MEVLLKKSKRSLFQLTYYIKADIIINNAGNCEKLNNIRSKIMKKFIALLIAVIMVVGVVGLVGCKGGDNETTTNTTTESTKQTTTTTTEATTTTTTTTTTTAETTTEPTFTTNIPMFARFDFGTDTYAEANGLTAHEYLTTVLQYNQSNVKIEFLEDSWKITALRDFASNDGADAFALSFENLNDLDSLLASNLNDDMKPAKVPYAKLRIKNNSENNMIGFQFRRGSEGQYFTTCIASNMFLQGGETNTAATPSDEWKVYYYDIVTCACLASNRPKEIAGANVTTWQGLLAFIKETNNRGNNWIWSGDNLLSAIRFHFLGAYSPNYSSETDSRKFIKSGATVEIDYIVFGESIQQLETYKSKSELAA